MAHINSRGFMKVIVTGEHREGVCRKCDLLLEKEFFMDGTRRKVRMVCPSCGGEGRLIAKTYSVQPPNPPQCLKIKCLYRFFIDTLFCALLSTYHSRRVAYAETNRHKEILERYRTGDPSPKTLWQAIHANLKLRCPLCRKYNRDPFLFGKKTMEVN